MSDSELGMLPEEWREICNHLEIPYDENEDEGEMESLPSDQIPPNYPENEITDKGEDNLLETFGLQELFSDCAPLELLSPHSEDNILESKGDMKIEPIESYEVGDILAYFSTLSNLISSNRLQNTVTSSSPCTSREQRPLKSDSFVKVICKGGYQQRDNHPSLYHRCACQWNWKVVYSLGAGES